MNGVGWDFVLLSGAVALGACSPGADRVDGPRILRAAIAEPVPGKPAALYATIVNSSDRPDSLVGLSSPAADSLTLHEQMQHGAMMVMRGVPAVAIPPRGQARLAPGGLHGMVFGAEPALVTGDSVAVTFRFAREARTVIVPVVSYADLERALSAPGSFPE